MNEARQERVLEDAAQDLVETMQPYRVLTRKSLASLSQESLWHDIDFDQALNWAVEHGLIHELEPDLYELPPQDRPAADAQTPPAP